MARRLWVLVEWVDDQNLFASYGIVHLDTVSVSNNDIHPGNVIHVCERTGENPRRAQVLRVSEEKRNVKEHKMLLERQDLQVKSVLTMCMRTIKQMKAEPLTSVYNNMSSSLPMTIASGSNVIPAVIAESVPSDSESENESLLLHQTQEVYRTGQNGTNSAHHTRHEVAVKGRHNQSVSHSQQRRPMVSSTPLTAKPDKQVKLTFDQGTQTDTQSSQFQVEKIQRLETVVDTLYARYQALLQHLQESQREATLSEEPHDTESDKDHNESLHENHHEEADRHNHNLSNTVETNAQVPSPRALHIRRVSAHTTNNSEVNNTVNNNDLVPIGCGHASVPGRLLNDINWGCHTSATRQLLQAVFPRRILATHSLTGKPSPAFSSMVPKQRLDPLIVEDIINTVSTRCGVPKSVVRHNITVKCTDEAKLYRNRTKQRQSRQANTNQENVPPSPLSSHESVTNE